MIRKKLPVTGLHHVALSVQRYQATRSFYVDVVGMRVEWEPDRDNVYLTSGRDNLALHRVLGEGGESGQRLDHIGFVLPTMGDVDRWYERICDHGIEVVEPPRNHRDGARSFYCFDPDGTKVQFIFHPPLKI